MFHLEYPLKPPNRLTIGSDSTCWANRGELSTTGKTSRRNQKERKKERKAKAEERRKERRKGEEEEGGGAVGVTATVTAAADRRERRSEREGEYREEAAAQLRTAVASRRVAVGASAEETTRGGETREGERAGSQAELRSNHRVGTLFASPASPTP
ncbi:uncharacterized protein DS421_4g115700 [Arachis hypogaea]|nr:uncharacterized protein DS421_4g115700 [Arachis hypogaea]